MLEVANMRWTQVNALSDGRLYAQAYAYDGTAETPTPTIEVILPAGSTEREVYDVLRVQILKTIRKPVDTPAIKNNRGDVI